MKKFKRYLLITLALAALFALSIINRIDHKTAPCCPLSVQQGNGNLEE